MPRFRPLLLLAFMVLLAACGGNGFEDALVGRWEGDSTDASGVTRPATWEFFEDGTVIVTVASAAGGSSSVAGIYQFEDDDTIIILEREGDADPGRRDIRMPDGDTLILTAPVSGAQDILRRGSAEGGEEVAAPVVSDVPTVEPVPATVEATAAPTETPTLEPTATLEATATAEPTVVPLGEADLGPLLIVEGDLPDNLDGELVETGETFRFDREDVAPADNLVSQAFYDTEDERPAGGVAVYVYEDATAASQTYGEIVVDMTGLGGYFSEYLDNVGERAKLEDNGNGNRHLAFLRCHAFVEVFMATEREFDIVNYAQRLDERLTPVVCPAE